MGRGLARTVLEVTTSSCLEELIVHYDIWLVAAVTRFRALNVYEILLRVQLGGAMAFIDEDQVEVWTS